jgi:hypothetical protein
LRDAWREPIPGNHSKVATAATGVPPKELSPLNIRIIPERLDNGSAIVCVDANNLNRIQMIDGQAVLPGQETISSATNVAAHADRVARPCRDGDAILVIKLRVDIPQCAPTLDAEGAIRIRIAIDLPHRTEVNNNTAWIVRDKSFITMTPASNGDAKVFINRPLYGLEDLIGGSTDLDVFGRTHKSLIEAHGFCLVPRINRSDFHGRKHRVGQ